MAASAAKSVAQELGKLLVEEAKFLYGVEDKVEELQQELAWMQGFLQDVDNRQHKEELIRMWVSQVRDLAYEAQDIVEKYIHQVSTGNKGDRLWDFLSRFSCIIANARTIHEVGSDIDKLTQKILKHNTRLVSYGVKIRHVEDSLYNSRIRDLRHKYSVSMDKDLIERVEDTRKGVNELLADRTNVVGVVGMGGLGKTTLAREVYRNANLKNRFGCFVWVYVSQLPQKRLVVEEIFRALVVNPYDTMDVRSLDEENLCVEVNQVLTEKRCLIVLDDIWYEETWHLLKRAFSSIVESSTSKLLVTTRNEEVISHVDPNAFILRPTPLNDKESWALLHMKAFAKHDNAHIDRAMKEAGERMLKHCGGLPIAIVSLGGILATKNTVDEWKAVEEHVGIYLTNAAIRGSNETITEMELIRVLELSYNDLPFHLKPCFLCLGNFPEDTEIPADTLYQLWRAEGLVQAPDENGLDYVCMYEIAEQYLNELVKRCMIEVGQVYENGRIKTCRMHDVMRDLCWNKSKEEKFLEVCKMTGVDEKDGRSSARGCLLPSTQVWRCHRVVVHVGVDEQSDKLFNGLEESSVKPRSAFVFMPMS